MVTRKLNLDVNQALIERGERCDSAVVTRREGLGFDPFTDGAFPRFAARAAGSKVWDVDGNEYLDYVLGFGTVLLGHADRRVIDALTRELATGACLSPLWRPCQIELNELLVSVIPHAQMSYLLRTGSDATSAAVRLARLYTGRTKVVHWGYHGWHDWSTPRTAGILASVREHTLGFEYNDLDSLRRVFAAHGPQIACVLMMPLELEVPDPGFLQGVRDIAHEHGSLFILDEMRSGFRLALGGAQEYFGVTADLVTLGKGMSNGHPISAVVGRADVLRCHGRTHMESTYFGNSAEMAAALTTIAIVREGDVLPTIWKHGERLLSGFRSLIEEFDVPARAVGLPPCPFLDFTDPDPYRRSVARQAFFTETMRRGVLFEPDHHWFISAAHTAADIDTTLDACHHGFTVAQRELEKTVGRG